MSIQLILTCGVRNRPRHGYVWDAAAEGQDDEDDGPA